MAELAILFIKVFSVVSVSVFLLYVFGPAALDIICCIIDCISWD